MRKLLPSVLVLILISVSSCKLLTIESAQEPLSKTELNIRLRTQAFVGEASERIERAADSLIANSASKEVKMNALRWKIYAVDNFGKVGFQTSPRIALMDTWALMLEMDQFLNGIYGEQMLGEEIEVIRKVNSENVRQVESIAANMMSEKEFSKHKQFVYDFVATTNFEQNGFTHSPVRASYLDFRKTPDSLAVATVGSLSEVMADLNSRMSYASQKIGKQIKWNTELTLREQGMDSLNVYAIADSLNARIDALVRIANNSPELLDQAIASFARDMQPMFNGLRYELARSMNKLGEERLAMDTIIAREREKLDSLVARERAILVDEANSLADDFANNVMVQVKDMVSSVLFYIALILAIILFIPFGLGYVTGKTLQAKKNKQT
ncbi:hypothetical protein BXY85_2749 [Roseivirga pacifica]|uniref:Chemotaxis protein n=1 Tax=Roseivirga pacifica TaxID=1267423 RepID=A0A1I0P533_9BACT|nr:hypothetical protein [Roseivirga pacifica]RKQ51718.1 hypothetical protein BXY85_2749 [Roseivirga pacifica]SEW09477.1 hypothetical protein SAMN05216290_1730 [Roseivirga pacifica]